jgi:hypothetical protein
MVSTVAVAQQIGFGLGTTIQNLSYTNSDGVKADQLTGLPAAAISFSYLQTLKTKSKAAFSNSIMVQLGYKGGYLKDEGSHLLTTWSMNFLSASAGFVSHHNSKRKTNPFFGAGIVTDALISGTQNRGFEQYDLTDDLKILNLSAKIFTGLSYKISNEANCSLELNYLRGFRNMEKSAEQSAMLHAWQLSATLFFQLKKTK